MQASRLGRLALCAAALLAWVGAGCDGGGGAPASEDTSQPPSPYACEVGHRDADGRFVALADGDRIELELGFQGFLFVEVCARTFDPSPPDRSLATAVIEVADRPPVGVQQSEVGFSSAPDGGRVSDDVLIYLSPSTISYFADRRGELSLRLAGDQLECTTAGSILLVDDDPCIHTGDVPICPDDDRDAGGPP